MTSQFYGRPARRLLAVTVMLALLPAAQSQMPDLERLALDDPNDYVRIELQRQTMSWASRKPMGLTQLPAAAMAVDDHHRLAWLVGRADIDGLGQAGMFA